MTASHPIASARWAPLKCVMRAVVALTLRTFGVWSGKAARMTAAARSIARTERAGSRVMSSPPLGYGTRTAWNRGPARWCATGRRQGSGSWRDSGVGPLRSVGRGDDVVTAPSGGGAPCVVFDADVAAPPVEMDVGLA